MHGRCRELFVTPSSSVYKWDICRGLSRWNRNRIYIREISRSRYPLENGDHYSRVWLCRGMKRIIYSNCRLLNFFCLVSRLIWFNDRLRLPTNSVSPKSDTWVLLSIFISQLSSGVGSGDGDRVSKSVVRSSDLVAYKWVGDNDRVNYGRTVEQTEASLMRIL